MFDGGRSATDDGQTGLVGLVLLLGVDRFLNEARAVTNLIGNGIGTIAIAAMKNPQAAPPTPIVKADTLP
jgi:Na+/H+-dicarboxylate symporter